MLRALDRSWSQLIDSRGVNENWALWGRNSEKDAGIHKIRTLNAGDTPCLLYTLYWTSAVHNTTLYPDAHSNKHQQNQKYLWTSNVNCVYYNLLTWWNLLMPEGELHRKFNWEQWKWNGLFWRIITYHNSV